MKSGIYHSFHVFSLFANAWFIDVTTVEPRLTTASFRKATHY